MTFPGSQGIHFQWINVVIFILTICSVECRYSQVKLDTVDRWARTGFQHLKLNMCRRASTLMERQCKKFSLIHQSGLVVYVSESSSDKVVAILPDSHHASLYASKHDYLVAPAAASDKRPQGLQSAHDAVLVLDPSPGESFGHPVALFYVDFNITRKKCEHGDGFISGQDCLTVALKDRCQNQLRPRRSHPERRGRAHIQMGAKARAVRAAQTGGHCEVHFLPLVVGVGDSARTQRLHCVDLPHFAQCPRLLPSHSPGDPAPSCELDRNTRRCHRQPLTTHLACRLYQTCDHAVLLSGGWRQQVTHQQHARNLRLFYQMLRNNGFHKNHIKIFFAGSGQLLEAEMGGAYPATEKEVIRNHISYVCRKQNCADSLVLYLNSPTRSDGTMLLWDSNNDGIADQRECYSVDELLANLAGCRANRVLLFVEQSYSTVIHSKLSKSFKHGNVVLLGASPWIRTAEFWASLEPRQCLIDHLSQGPALAPPTGHEKGLLNITLAGAPCSGTLTLTEAELQREHMGCQNLPTAVWYQNRRRMAEEGY
ncbi:uncharacterized protein LOC125725207 [Brienomyrus brachyistius]|uniref:uncharacterized protein LOC125725207 n=1 Tax=Brienomyrus brachyistius TaxID=42636 RepID=UPI0020B3EC40|nr:uncharacterized protein LOC125725207 [Brienomyrus brachyistius]